MPWTVSITGRDGGNYQNYIGLQEGKWETSLLLAWNKKMHKASDEELYPI